MGMSKEELLSSLGTIARSGTAKFMEQMKEAHDANLIGQVGLTGANSCSLISCTGGPRFSMEQMKEAHGANLIGQVGLARELCWLCGCQLV